MTQADRILDYIDKFGSISPVEAFYDLVITKLATRISEMIANGEQISKQKETRRNRFGEKVTYMRYTRGGGKNGR